MFCTALAESNLTYLRQHGDGPALGLFQVEVATFNDIYRRYLGTRPDITRNLQPLMTGEAPHLQLITNLSFAAAICRLRYWMDPSPSRPTRTRTAWGRRGSASITPSLGQASRRTSRTSIANTSSEEMNIDAG